MSRRGEGGDSSHEGNKKWDASGKIYIEWVRAEGNEVGDWSLLGGKGGAGRRESSAGRQGGGVIYHGSKGKNM